MIHLCSIVVDKRIRKICFLNIYIYCKPPCFWHNGTTAYRHHERSRCYWCHIDLKFVNIYCRKMYKAEFNYLLYYCLIFS